MLRFLRLFSLSLLTTFWLIYASSFGLGLCLGLMTWNLPWFIDFLLPVQLFAVMFTGCGVPAVGLYAFVKTRRPLFLVTAATITIWIWWLPFMRDGWTLRKQGLRQSATLMSSTLVSKLEAYRAKNGRYPAKLEELGVPIQTGMVSYPASKIRYRLADASSDFKGYELRVLTGWGMFGFDSFFFWPDQTYPARIYGGSVEIIQIPRFRWAYVHE